jgi:hypothetical protein
MTVQRDFLERAPGVVGSTSDELLRLMAEQNDYLQDIALYLRRQNADVLCSAVVKSTSQLDNSIRDANSHEVVFEVGGKPVEIFHLLAFSTWGHTVGLSVLSLAAVTDGIPLASGDVYDLSVPTYSVFVMAPNAALNAPLIVNGPSPNADTGGLFLYGYTVPDWDRIRNAIRS